jgi:acetyl-CoA synthetase
LKSRTGDRRGFSYADHICADHICCQSAHARYDVPSIIAPGEGTVLLGQPIVPRLSGYDAIREQFRWPQPAAYNIGVEVCDRWAAADPQRIALIDSHAGGRTDEIPYAALRDASNRLANALRALGIVRGDRVAILLPQGPDVAVSHIAIYKLAAVALPLAMLFGVDAITYRLQNSGARALITNAAGLAKLAESAGTLPDRVLSVDGPHGKAAGFHETLARASSAFTPEVTSPDDPAMMIYTSGTTGQPKGALHGHRVLIGHQPGIEMQHEFLPQLGDRFWTPADWAWAGGLLNCLLPSLLYGVPVVARRTERFDPEEAFTVMAAAGVRNVFIPPTALRMMRAAPAPKGRHKLNLRTVGAAGEALGAETLEWGKSALGLVINEFYGQTECNLVVGSCAAIGISRPGAIGKPCPGHTVGVIRPDGTPCAPGETGQIAVRRPDPVMFLGYWGNEAATRAKFTGDWMTTGDQGIMDADGYIAFLGRDDDVITSSGYRIGPGEIEDCLIRHPAVSLAAVVGKPDPVRTEIVKAFIVLKPGVTPTHALAAEIQEFVRHRLSAHEYPREVAFIDDMPMTTTGKVIRRLLRARG